MDSLERRFAELATGIPRLLLPRPNVDLSTWAVIACDQYTSEPAYWDQLDRQIGDAPSSLRLILPECYLEDPDRDRRIAAIRDTMRAYLRDGVLRELAPGFVYVRRMTGHGRLRQGLVVALDLDSYDYRPGSTSLIRATEQTIAERIPPRKAIRSAAPLELPHILVLVDDPENRLFGSLAAATDQLPLLYDFDLAAQGGHVSGFHVAEESILATVANAIGELVHQVAGASLLYAVGDGNHSLATAKAVWDEAAAKASERRADHPARWALAEIVNVHDPGLTFEPIHRILFDTPMESAASALRKVLGTGETRASDFDTMAALVHREQAVGLLNADAALVFPVPETAADLPVGLVERAVEELVEGRPGASVDYVHGDDTFRDLGGRPGNTGVYVPGIPKEQLFSIIGKRGPLPRKSFSMGEAEEKRFYLEARKIVPD
jgi:hypothetical protein